MKQDGFTLIELIIVIAIIGIIWAIISPLFGDSAADGLYIEQGPAQEQSASRGCP